MRRKVTCWALVYAAIVLAPLAYADSWHLIVGAQDTDKGVQALAFLPNEIWIHAGDNITWTFPTPDHSVTFLTQGQPRPTFQVGCPGTTPDGSPFDGSACVNSGRVEDLATTYTIAFLSPGNFRMVCLVHTNMTGIVHVLDRSEVLPHGQEFYDAQAKAQARDLLSDRDGELAKKSKVRSYADGEHAQAHQHQIVTGAGEIVSTPGGVQSVSLMRFLQPSITVHAGETVEWNSLDVSGHAITFGEEPPNLSPSTPPSANVFSDPDGARHAIINSTADNVHSGLITQAPQERTGLAQAPPGATRFRVTFTLPGRYRFKCPLHDQQGMTGEVLVLP